MVARPRTRRKSEPAQLVPMTWGAIAKRRVVHERSRIIFAQGDPAATVMFLETGNIRLSVVSRAGKEATIAIVEAGHFFGEGCLAGQPLRMATATAMDTCTVVTIEKREMAHRLHAAPEFRDRFLAHMLSRNIRIEEDLIDQLFNSSEKRLARALLLLARYGADETPRLLPHVSQELLAETVGTTRSRVNFFMNKFRKLGFIEDDGGLKIHPALLDVVLHD